MTTEEYFKDKINWRIYNIILDASTELDDKDIHHILSVEVCDNAFGQEIFGTYTECKAIREASKVNI